MVNVEHVGDLYFLLRISVAIKRNKGDVTFSPLFLKGMTKNLKYTAHSTWDKKIIVIKNYLLMWFKSYLVLKSYPKYGRTDSRNVLVVVVEIEDSDFYKLANKNGTLKQLYTRNQ